MASRNRCDPWGRIFESSQRGYFMGNRDFGDAWITCSLRHPDGSVGPSNVGYRKLFFLDEATALAASHRPCGQCRRKDYDVFKRFWAAATDAPKVESDPQAGRAWTTSMRIPPNCKCRDPFLHSSDLSGADP
jgi:hypothetical protein